MNSPVNEELSKSVRDILIAHNIPEEFQSDPLIEEHVIEVFVPVYEKEIVEVPQVCYSNFWSLDV
jgi:hypothetical protein